MDTVGTWGQSRPPSESGGPGHSLPVWGAAAQNTWDTPGLFSHLESQYPVSLLAVAPPDDEVSLLGDERCAHLSHEVPEGLCILSVR